MGTAAELAHLLHVGWALMLGNTVEWYEFAVYGYLEAYLEENFFHGSSIATWLGFTVTFVARPLGGLVLGRLGDVLGRKKAVNISIVAMLVGTCCQGLLPTYSSGCHLLGHLGVVLLIFFRLLQGISAAGEVSMIATYILEVSPHRSLCRGAAILSISGQVGFLSAKFVVYALEEALGMEAMKRWGWRIPFIFALLPGLVSVWGRRWMPETELFLEEQRQKKKAMEDCQKAVVVDRDDGKATVNHPVDLKKPHEEGRGRENLEEPQAIAAELCSEDPKKAVPQVPCPPSARTVLASHGANVVIGIFSIAAFHVHTYGGMVWTQSYLLDRGLSPGDRMLTDLCARGIMMLLSLPLGWLADVRGIGWVTFVGCCLLALGGLPLFALLVTHAMSLATVLLAMGVGMGTIGAVVGTIAWLLVAELFPTSIRGLAVGISYNVGVCMFGGLAPLAFEASLGISPWGPGVLLSVSGLISSSAIATGVYLHRRGVVQMVHVRPVPYFHPFDMRDPQAKAKAELSVEPNSDEANSIDCDCEQSSSNSVFTA